MSPKAHLTTRRGFIAAMGFGAVSLYGLWAAYGAAPTPLALLGHSDGHPGTPEGGHAGHDGHGAAGPNAEEFQRRTGGFIKRYGLPDGTVHPRRLAPPAAARGAGHSRMENAGLDHAGMDHSGMDHSGMDHSGMDHSGMDHGVADPQGPAVERAPAQAVDVYLAAGMWYYRPNRLRLDAGQPYRFRMMALDVSHGASIQFGRGGRMVRLRPGRLTEMEITFHRPGRHLVYCTVYCGPAHDVMQAEIEVV
jgi:cytochrome c oxidase subunit II